MENKMDLYRFKYAFKNIVLTLDQDYPIRDEMAINFAMILDVAHRTQPIIQFTLQLEKDLVVLLYQNKDKAKIKFDIYEMQYDGKDNKINTDLWLQHSWNIIPIRDLTHYINAQDIETIQFSDPMAQPQAVEMYLVDRDIFNKFSQQISVNRLNISKPSILQSIFEDRGISKKSIVATPPEDSSVIDRAVLELGTLVGNFDELNMRYGIYTANAVLFHDLERLYCINRLEPNVIIKSSTEFDTVTFVLINSSNPESHVIGGTTDFQRKKHFINLQGAPEIMPYDESVYLSEFSNLESIDNKGDVNTLTLRNNWTKLNYIYKHNRLSEQQQINEKLLTDQFVSFITHSPISYFKPYKTYTFVTDTQYNNLDISDHRYRLLYLEFGISKEGAEYESSIQPIIYRVNK